MSKLFNLKLFTTFVLLLISNFSCADIKNETPKEQFYRGGTTRGMYYAYLLIKNSPENERIEFEQDFASRAFNYWVLRENDEIAKNKVVEYWIKKLLTAKLIREEIWSDPLSRNKNVGHLAGPIKFHITEKNYPKLVKDFTNFAMEIAKDHTIPSE